ncbi:putative disease resistance protein RGA3 [Prunus yedoensis var. nudiflora]|uniref:Putative disease resistance protein RGA3 n=1 Tax=Prunus yedoensis var. nudiflora TaxID=2094558 RepID=A0A314Y528_PRUYE|nr:putative disease resistance protein RGA3 [Prunus yedoensis var. nudiflora]
MDMRIYSFRSQVDFKQDLDTQGSSILVTTRSEKVAKIVQTLPICNLGKLSDDQCWLILKNRAFLDDSAPLTKDQERIGRDIAKKCAGLPLLAKEKIV